MTDTDYIPKHMKQYDDHFDHCCFAGCTPMNCPGRCCANMGWHTRRCSLNPSNEFDQAMHDMYVNMRMPKHFVNETPAPRPVIEKFKRSCPECGGEAVIYKRVCFGADPHNMYRCVECR
jgi:hypothetical protein